jgi:malate dehydrogenase (oxaloacetate-decarboxylating)
MFTYKYVKNNQEEYIETSLSGKSLLTLPQLNKGTAFPDDERRAFKLLGKLPLHVETLDEQVKRAYLQFCSYATLIQKNIYLNNLHDKNQVLFYKLVTEYLVEMMPIIYTPIVGLAVKEFHRKFQQPRGLYISYPDRENIEEILNNRTNSDIDLIVITDGERILGLGDQGVGGIDIPIAKLMLYTLCASVNPMRTLPIQLDVGTNNQELLDDPLYLGWRHKRIQGQEYDDFLEQVIGEIEGRFPQVFLHWEDFGRDNARRNLERFENRLCSFNDDIQGTGAVTLAALLSAVKVNQSTLAEQHVVVYGAGTAGTGIADQIFDAMVRQGLSEEEARKRFYLIDRPGLLLSNMSDLMPAQIRYARTDISEPCDLLTTIKQVKPTILIGCSAQGGAFTREVIEAMLHATHHRPIIMPLSNPTECAEANPADIMEWTQGRALVATGSPFEGIAQCNNALVFPGIGLGVLAVKAKKLTESMIWAACEVVSQAAPVHSDPAGAILPGIGEAKMLAGKIARAVAEQACSEGLARVENIYDLDSLIEQTTWESRYLPYKQIFE